VEGGKEAEHKESKQRASYPRRPKYKKKQVMNMKEINKERQ
jgi:hypothetical protein